MRNRDNSGTQGIILASPHGREGHVCTLPDDEIVVGRCDVEDPSQAPALDLNPDLRVSRRHCRLWRANGTWHIEDLSSKHGTHLAGGLIQKGSPREFVPGTPVQSGDTIWTIVPKTWLLIQSDGVLVSGPHAKAINYAAYHCGLPVVGPLRAYNLTARRSPSWRLELLIKAYGDPVLLDVPEMDARATVLLRTVWMRLDADRLEACSSPGRGELSIRVHEKPSVSVSREIAILPGWSWSYEDSALKTLAAFVSPDHATVEDIARRAHERIGAQTSFPSLKALVRSGGKDATELAFRAIYEYLKDDCALRWCPPEGKQIFQNIKPVHRILSMAAVKPEGEATCVDLALLMAGCLENAGLLPLIVLTGGVDESPRHAFAGCWTGALPTGRMVIRDREFLRRQIQTGSLLLVECTAFVEGPGQRQTRLSFAQAMWSAEAQLLGEPQVCAIDVGAARPPYGPITPMSSPLTPVVKQAFLAAEQLARNKRCELIETLFLFYGCIVAGGEVLSWSFEQAGWSRDDLRDRIAGMVQARSFSGKPSVTQGYSDCQQSARQIASMAGAASVEEHHLLWALLSQRRGSGRFQQVCQRIGIDLDRLEKILACRYPPPLTSVWLPHSVLE